MAQIQRCKVLRFVIARSEATWQSRSTRPDPRKVIGEIVTAFPRLPRPLRGLAMTSRGRLPFYRQHVPAVSAPPGAACRSPTMAGAINVTAFPRLHPKGTSSRFALRAPRPLRGLAMTSRGRLPFYRQPAPAVSALPGAACRSPTMACAISVSAFPRLPRPLRGLAMTNRKRLPF